MFNEKRRELIKMFGLLGSSLAMAPSLYAKIPENEVLKWDEEWDVIVVGTGFAGDCAFLTVKEEGVKDVLMIDKMPYVGGNSNFSGGDYAISGTKLQKDFGITTDSVELHIKDTLKSGENLNDTELVRIMVTQGLEDYYWLEKQGVKWETVDRSGGHSVARNHSAGAGSDLLRPLRERIKELGGVVRTNTIMDEIIYNEKGSVVGIKVREKYTFKFDRDFDENDNKSGVVKYYKARGGVIVATGGWAADKKFRQKMDPQITPDVLTTNHMGATGYTIQKLMKDNIKTIDMQYIQRMHVTSIDENSFGFGYGFIYLAYNFGVMVNPKTGKRFVNEIANRKISSDAILGMSEAGTNPPVLIMDYTATRAVMEMDVLQRAMEVKAVHKFETLDELIEFYKINKEPFLEQLKRYNEFVRSGKDPEFGRTFEQYKGQTLTVEKPPFFAARPSPKVHHCMGGVKNYRKMSSHK